MAQCRYLPTVQVKDPRYSICSSCRNVFAVWAEHRCFESILSSQPCDELSGLDLVDLQFAEAGVIEDSRLRVWNKAWLDLKGRAGGNNNEPAIQQPGNWHALFVSYQPPPYKAQRQVGAAHSRARATLK